MKRPFVIDYSITGTLHLSSANASAVAWRAQRIINEAMRDLREVSVYCEEEIAIPIDAIERYGVPSAALAAVEKEPENA